MVGSSHGFAALDPAYTLSAPMGQALSGAFDMLSHSMDTYFGKPYDNSLSGRIALANMRCIVDDTRAMVVPRSPATPRSPGLSGASPAMRSRPGRVSRGPSGTLTRSSWASPTPSPAP